MTGVTSNLGDGDLIARARKQRGTDLASATLSAPHLTTSWIGVTPEQRARLAACLRDLADQLDALDAHPVDPEGPVPPSLGVDPIDGLGDTPLVSGAGLLSRKDHI